jgi:hypothetical protein
MGAVWYYAESNPAMSRMGTRTLERILADAGAVPERTTWPQDSDATPEGDA